MEFPLCKQLLKQQVIIGFFEVFTVNYTEKIKTQTALVHSFCAHRYIENC